MKVLFVTWHFPPSSEIAGKVAFRLVRALAQRGDEVTVITVPASSANALDPEYGRDLPEGVRVVRVAPRIDWLTTILAWKNSVRQLASRRVAAESGAGAPLPAANPGASRLLDSFRNWYRFPDWGKLWSVPLQRELMRRIGRDRPDVLFTVSPMLSTNLAALRLVRAHPDVHWWAWSHDPSTANPFDTHANTGREATLAAWEAEMIQRTARFCVTTEEMADALELRYGKRPLVMQCGFDPAEMPAAVAPPASGPLTLTHAGTLYVHRTPVALLEAVAVLRGTHGLGPRDIRIRLIGDASDLHGEPLHAMISRLDLGDMVSVEPPVSHAAALRAVQESHVGIVLAERQPLQIPAKTFDYVGLGRPVLALADGATAALVHRHRLGVVASRETAVQVLADLLAEYRADGLAAMSRRVREASDALSMASQAERLDRDFEGLVGRTP